jgi:tetratricopeptide (TPR) repeat protein
LATPRTWALPAGLALLLLGLLILVLAWREGLSGLVATMPGAGAGLDRLILWRNSLPLARDYILTGGGLGNYPMLYSTYALLLHVGFITHSHNFLLNVLLEQGLLALVALGWMGLAFARLAWRGLIRPGPGPGTPTLGYATLAFLIVAAQGLVHNSLYSGAGALLLFLPLAFALPPERETRPALPPSAAALALPLGLVLLLALSLIWRKPLLAHIYANLGSVHQSQAELSVYHWPQWPIQDAVRREIDLSRPIAEFQQAVALDPRNATANRRLGMIELSRGEYADALDHLAAAYQAEPGSTTTRQLYGEALLANGHLAKGQALWAGLDNGQGQLDIRAWWYRHMGDTQRAAWIAQAAAQ